MRTIVLIWTILATAALALAADSVTATLSSGSNSFTLTAGSTNNPAAATITATSTYALAPPNKFYVYAFFSNSTMALSDGAGNFIPSSALFISNNGGNSTAVTSNAAFNAGLGGANAGLQLEYLNVGPSNRTGTVTDAMTFRIDLSGVPQLPAGTYSGTIYIQAIGTGPVQGVGMGPGGSTSGPLPITLTATLPESLTVSLSGSSVTFNLTPGSASNPGNTTVTATTSWVMRPSRTTVRLYAAFAGAAAALTDGAGNHIPSSAFFVSDNGGAPAALTNTVPFGGPNAGLQLASVPITTVNANSSRADALSFNIDLTNGTLPQLPAGVYTGTLYIQAQTTP